MGRGSSIITISSVLGLTTLGCRRRGTARAKPRSWGSPATWQRSAPDVGGSASTRSRPAGSKSEMTDQLDPDDLEGQIRDRIVAGRLGEVDEAAAGVVFLASDSVSYISGVTLPADGGH